MGVEDEHKRKPDLVQIEEFYRFTEIQSEILENLKPSLSASWAEFLQNSMLLPQPVNGPQVSLEDFKDYLQLGGFDDFSSCGDGDGRLISGIRHGNGEHDDFMQDLSPVYFDAEYSIDGYLARFQGTNQESDGDLLDSLTRDLELVESRIFEEASAKNSSLVEVSKRLDELIMCMKSIQSTIISTNMQISEIRRSLVDQSKTASNCRCLRTNLKGLVEICQAVQDILAAKSELESSLEGLKFSSLGWQLTLSLLDEMSMLLQSVPFNDNINVCRSMGKHIERMTSLTLKTIREELLLTLSFDVDRCVADSITLASGTSKDSGSTVKIEYHTNLDKDKEGYLELLIVQLCKCNGLRESLIAYKHACELTIRKIIVEIMRRLLKSSASSSVPTDTTCCFNTLARQLNNLDNESFLLLLSAYVDSYESYDSHYERSEHLMIQILHKIEQKGNVSFKNDEDFLLEMRGRRSVEMVATWKIFLQGLGDELNTKPCVHILTTVSAYTSSLSSFIGDCSKDIKLELEVAVHNLGISMLQKLQKESHKRISRALEEETWRFVEDLRATGTSLLELGHLLGTKIEFKGAREDSEMASSSSMVVLQNKSYRLIHACLVTLTYIQDVLSLCEVMPSLSKDAAHQTLETMRMFNSKTCQLILGAGAMQVSGLRSITVKHLAVACHTIRFMLAVMPALFNYFEKTCDAQWKLLAAEMHKTELDLQVHCSELISKVIEVMSDRFPSENDIRQTMASYVQSSATCSEDVMAPSELAQSACKQVQILTKILNSTCLLEDSKTIVERIADSLKRPYEVILTQGSEDSGLNRKPVDSDLNYLTECICRLDVSGIQ